MLLKEETLKKNGCFNHNYENVAAGIFKTCPFFDRMDIVQVKYEMIRAVSNAEGSVAKISGTYGFSRKSYYQTAKAFQSSGLCALIPKKTGPKKPHKLNGEAAAFVDSFLANHINSKSKEISAALKAETGISIHPRTIHRYLKKN
jgi:transposase